MGKSRYVKQLWLLIGLITMVSSLVYADRDDRDRREQKSQLEQRGHSQNVKVPPKGYVLDKRFGHDQYYPRPGLNLNKLPPKHYIVRHGNDRYYYSGGIWYRPYSGHYVVITPPIGLFVPVLPAFYTTIWFGGVPYYYANDTYYVWDAGQGGYVVTNPPPNATAPQPPPVDSDQLYIYPKQGQSEQQQANDRYACHEWSVKQTAYDPSQPPPNMPQDELNNKRMDYQRATKACLEGRGYTVQ